MLKFNLSSAKAIAATGTSTSRALSGSRDLISENVLVKIMEDGTTQSLITSVENSNWNPTVSFLSVGDDGSVYICFSGGYTPQLIRVFKNDNHYETLWPPESSGASDWTRNGQVATWSWWGMDSDPLVKAADGKLYFKVSATGSSIDDRIYCYDPSSNSPPTRVTPESANLSIGNFIVDSKNHLFIQSASNDFSSSAYLRYYKPNIVAPINVYYASDSSKTWVRGYTASPDGDYIILNGYNIRGMNGIIKAAGLDSDCLTYELLYGNSNGNNNWISLCKLYDWNGDSYDTTIIRQTTNIWPCVYAFEKAVLANGSTTSYDKAKLIDRIKRYFKDPSKVDFKPGIVANYDGADVTAEQLLSKDLSENKTILFSRTTWNTATSPAEATTEQKDTSTLASYISNYGEDFLRNTFGGSELFKDWLVKQDVLLRSINFDNIGAMTWASDGLYGLYGTSWWGGSTSSSGTQVVKLVDRAGNQDLKVISLKHSTEAPSKIKLNGDYLYYRYDVNDPSGNATGYHKLARLNIVTKTEEEITSDLVGLPQTLEILSYDVSDDNAILYFAGYNQMENKVIGGKVDLVTKTWSQLDTAKKLNSIRIIK